jgi:ABC-type cobalamin/Fe3+-siderophores transport system ATPase subunit
MSHLAATNLKLARGGATLLSDISIDLGSKGSVAIIGPNGAGKSMLLKILAGIEAPTAGQVMFGDRAMSDLSSEARAERIGYLPQQFEPHWNLSVADLVRLGAERTRRHDKPAVEQVIREYELTALRQRRWSTLSGGERARVLLAMVLAIDPPVLLADEPAASLDIKHRLHVVQALASRGKDRLSIVVMHDLDLAFWMFDRVVVMDRGRIAADRPARELVNDPILDAVFGVRFDRLDTAHGPVLRAGS